MDASQELLTTATFKFKTEAEAYLRQIDDAEDAAGVAQSKLALKAEALAASADRLAAAEAEAAALRRELADGKTTMAEQVRERERDRDRETETEREVSGGGGLM